jgi:hypothetical protein
MHNEYDYSGKSGKKEKPEKVIGPDRHQLVYKF